MVLVIGLLSYLWIDQIDFQIVDNDLNLCVNSEFVKTSIEKKVFDKILNVSKSISEIDNCIFILDPSKKVKKRNSLLLWLKR